MRSKELVWDYFDLTDIDWKLMIKNSRNSDQNLNEAKNEGGKSLLQVCIENEKSDGSPWQLQVLMELLLDDEDVNPNKLDQAGEYTLLSFCYINKKHRAFGLMIEKCAQNSEVKQLEINMRNPFDNTTIYGLLFYNSTLEFFCNEGYQPDTKLALLLANYGNEINRNMPQICSDKYNLKTPIYYYLRNKHDFDKISRTVDELVATDTF